MWPRSTFFLCFSGGTLRTPGNRSRIAKMRHAMTVAPEQSFVVAAAQAGQTLAALLRVWLPGQSWSQVRKLIAGRRVRLNGELWLDDARRLKAGDSVEILARPAMAPKLIDAIVIRHIDSHLVVVEKPPGISTVRHPK